MATETVLLERPAVVRATSADVPLEEGPNNSAPAQCDKPCEVRPGLFIGSSVTEASWYHLKAYGITHILQVIVFACASRQPSAPSCNMDGYTDTYVHFACSCAGWRRAEAQP